MELDCVVDELSPIQLEQYEKAEKEHNEIRSKLNDIMRGSSSENIFSGNIFSAYQLTGLVTGLESYAKAPAAIRTQNRKIVKSLKSRVQPISDDDDVEEVPLSKRVLAPVRNSPVMGKKQQQPVQKAQQPETAARPPNMKALKAAKTIATASNAALQKASEGNSYGGLMIGSKAAPEPNAADRSGVDSQEVNFSKLQGKTYPSLVVFVRPTLNPKESVKNDRTTLDAKVKTVLMYTPPKFTEWLIQQGLVRSEMDCNLHPGTALKLGMYSEVNRFPYSGGYVWISECCKQRFTSVYCGSIFESSLQTPSVQLKLVYHWACQTNVQNVVQWVKVNNLFIKQFFTHLRAVCTVALYNHFGLLGGHGKKIEVGVISLGTSSADGAQRQVKVEVLGIYDPLTKQVRLRAVEPLPYSDKVYRKRFLKILEPLVDWVHEDTVILTDLTVDKVTLHNYGFRNVVQSNPADAANNPRSLAQSNITIMDYLRRVVPRMFQNTLSLLNRSMIQQFLDELVWREIFGQTPSQTYQNMLLHISEQTRINQRDRLTARLTKVSANPFKNWKHSGSKQGGGKGKVVAQATPSLPTPPPLAVLAPPVRKAAASAVSSSPVLTFKRKRSPPRIATPQTTPKQAEKKSLPLAKPLKRLLPPPPSPVIPAKRTYQKKAPEPVDMVSLEGYYYGIHVPRESEAKRDSSEDVVFEVKCPECELTFVTNLELQDHLFDHVQVVAPALSKYQCRYCFDRFREHNQLMVHIMDHHPIEVSRNNIFYDLICEQQFITAAKLTSHMLRSHYPSDLPYRCGCCTFASSSRRMTMDHFYEEHGKAATLMCPMCLQIFVCANRQQGALPENVNAFLHHLKEHSKNGKAQKQCNRCKLVFPTMGQLRVHMFMDHGHRFDAKQLQPISKSNTNIQRPKPKVPIAGMETFIRVVLPVDRLTLDVPNGRMCLECGQDYDSANHIIGQVQCPLCLMQSYCLPFMLEHTHKCSLLPPKVRLEQEYHCVCGFVSGDAVALTRHLISCERKTAYPSAELAQANIHEDTVLDGVGLVRTEEEGEPVQVPEEAPQEELAVLEQQVGDIDETGGFMTPEDYNPNLSLVDLAPTPSVIVQHMPEAVRDDYQDLQTPQAPDSHMMGYGGADDSMVVQQDGGSQVVLQTDLYQEEQHHFQGY